MPEDFSRRRFLAGTALAAGTILAGCSTESEQTTETEDETFDVGTRNTSGSQTVEPVDGGRFVDAFQQAKNSVVQIQVQTARGGGSGTGWLFDEQNHIVTNEHVVDGAERIFVRFRNSGWLTGEVLGEDVYSDLAVVAVDQRPDTATPLSLVTEDPAVGTEVLAIGNPFGLAGSVSSGIVSGVNRTLPAPNDFSIPDAIQTDAPVNPGNSGGPLVNLDGDVIGVINSGGGDNIGFAISGALTNRVVPALVEDGNYEHSYLGIRLQPVTPAIARANNLDVASGIYVHAVVPESPSAGVLEGSTGTDTAYGQQVNVGGDIIKAMDGTPIPTQQALSSFLALEASPGDNIEVEIIRDGERQTVTVTIGARPPPT